MPESSPSRQAGACGERSPASYTCPLTAEQAGALRSVLEETGWLFVDRPHTLYAAAKDKTQVAVYEKGPKLLVQGRGAGDFVRYVLEPRILGEARLDYDETLRPQMFEPRGGVDESGKGDFFGPLVIAAVFVRRETVRALLDAGVMDSKRISSDARIRELARIIRASPGCASALVSIGPAKYNELYHKFGNLNRLLAWGHARAIESLLEKAPDCPRVVSDQFANPALLRRALMERGRAVELVSQVRAEADLAVAAASVLARERFIDWLREAGSRLGVALPRGAGPAVLETARTLAAERGGEFLREVAKTHFRTAHAAAPDVYPEPPPRSEWRAPRA